MAPTAREIAAELAEHFVRGQDTGRAVQYLHQAAENALHRCANVEAIRHLTRGWSCSPPYRIPQSASSKNSTCRRSWAPRGRKPEAGPPQKWGRRTRAPVSCVSASGSPRSCRWCC